MLIERNFEKTYPEPPQCEVNSSDCDFDLDCICHDCGKYLCEDCAVYIRHQPRLVKYLFSSGGRSEIPSGWVESHCDDCKQAHKVYPRNMAIGGIISLLGISLIFVGADLNSLANIPELVAEMGEIISGGQANAIIDNYEITQLATVGVTVGAILSILLNIISLSITNIVRNSVIWFAIVSLINPSSIPMLVLGWFAALIGYILLKWEYLLKTPVRSRLIPEWLA